jgi:hypothetical protein
MGGACDRPAWVAEITCVYKRPSGCAHLGKMPRFITGDELGNLKAYTSATKGGTTEVSCSELLVETDKQKSIQKLAIAKSTVRNVS